MSTGEVTINSLPSVWVAYRHRQEHGAGSIGPVIQDLYAELGSALGRAGVAPPGPPTACYEDAGDEE